MNCVLKILLPKEVWILLDHGFDCAAMDERMTCDFTSFSTVFQSYQDGERLMRYAVCNGIPFTAKKISPGAGFELATARSVGQRLTHGATGPLIAPRNVIMALYMYHI